MNKADKKQFDSLAELVKSLATSVQALAETRADTKEDPVIAKEIQEAGPDDTPMNPHWRKLVKQILGEEFECETSYPKSGGVLFKVIVPKSKSNASQSYWEVNRRDVRTREIGHTGAEGVKKWCELIKSNLARTKREEI